MNKERNLWIQFKDEYVLIRKTSIFKLFLFILSFLLPALMEKFYYTNEAFLIDRYFIFSVGLLFISLHLIFDINKIWSYIYKYRYFLGIIVFLILVICGFHGSSIGIYDSIIEPSKSVNYSKPILGINRGIRGDEWAVSSLHNLSQGASINEFSIINKTMMGGISNPVNLYPKLPTKTLSVLLTPKLIGFLFLPLNNAFSFYWYFDYFILFFVSFEFFMLLTKKNKVFSLVGTFLTVFSPVVQWWESTSILWSGMLAIVVFSKFLKSNCWKKKILLSFLIGYAGSVYIMDLYPAWLITYGYFFLGIVIWLMIINKNNYGIKDILLLILIMILTITFFLFPIFKNSKEVYLLITNTVYPGARFSVGGEGWKNLFNYITSLFLPYIDFTNASEAAQYMSFFPIPLILGIKYIYINYRNHKIDPLLNILVLFSVLLSIWHFIPLPHFIAKITLLHMSTPARSQVVVGFMNLVIMIICLSNYTDLNKNRGKYVINFIIVMAIIFIGLYVIHTNYSFVNKKIVIFSLLFLFPISFYILNNENKKMIVWGLIFLSLVSGVPVHPLNKGLNVIYDKPVSRKIRQIVKSDKNAVWATIGTTYYVQNYVLANGAKVLNSTNYYPNHELWNTIDKNGKYDEIWNRYAHMTINLSSSDKTDVQLLYGDHIIVNLIPQDVCQLKISYLLSNAHNLNKQKNSFLKLKKIYSNENIYIYKTHCIIDK